jgi:hypothetical protein
MMQIKKKLNDGKILGQPRYTTLNAMAHFLYYTQQNNIQWDI